MRRLGAVIATPQGLVVCRLPGDDPPDIGADALNESLEDVGRVVDVFGPVARPYVAITPADGVRGDALLGQKLYAR